MPDRGVKLAVGLLAALALFGGMLRETRDSNVRA